VHEVEGVLEVLERERERRVALLDNVVEARDGLGLLEVLSQPPLATADRARELLRERLVLAELDQERLVEQVLDVLMVVEGRGGRRALVRALLVQRVARVDACTLASGTSHSTAHDIPLRIQRRRKSDSETWSFLSAWLRVT
jgi:hypothetical protein